MAECPSCAHITEEDFGVITCVACHHVFMVTFDGEIVAAEEDESPHHTPESEAPSGQVSVNHESPHAEDLMYGLVGHEEEDFSVSSSSAESLVGFDPPVLESEDEVGPEGAMSLVDGGAEDDDLVESFQGDSDHSDSAEVFFDGVPQAEPLDQNEPPSFSEEISDYAESADALPKEGPYVYQLEVRGLNTQEILKKLRKVLEGVGLESKDLVGWDPVGGVATIDWVGPVTAHRLVSQIASLPVEVVWTQRHFAKE